jgi:ABC-type sugar transport system permease subunit
MVIFSASMQSIPTSFYEAAILDGATAGPLSRTSPSH